jgi:prevent-host-death family protein
MTQVGIHEAKTRLSELLRRVAGGEEILILKGREPIARLVPVKQSRARRLGQDQGRYVVPEDFDAPLPDDLLDRFAG